MRKRNEITFLRRLCSIVLAVLATVCMTWGVLTVSAGQAFSRKTVRATLNQVNLKTEYGEQAAHLVNVAIKHFTGGLYMDNLYLTADTLMDCVDEQELREFLTGKFTEFGATLTGDFVAEINPEELLPLLSGVREHVQEVTGLRVTDEALVKELIGVMGGSVLRSTTSRMLHPQRGVWLIVLGVVMLLGSFAISWPKILWGSMWMIISLATSALLVWVFSFIVVNVINVDFIMEQIGATLVNAWLLNVRKLVLANAGRILLGAVLPGLLIVAYYIDWKRISRWKRMRGSN